MRREIRIPITQSTFPQLREENENKNRHETLRVYANSKLFPCSSHQRSAFVQKRKLPAWGMGAYWFRPYPDCPIGSKVHQPPTFSGMLIPNCLPTGGIQHLFALPSPLSSSPPSHLLFILASGQTIRNKPPGDLLAYQPIVCGQHVGKNYTR